MYCCWLAVKAHAWAVRYLRWVLTAGSADQQVLQGFATRWTAGVGAWLDIQQLTAIDNFNCGSSACWLHALQADCSWCSHRQTVAQQYSVLQHCCCGGQRAVDSMAQAMQHMGLSLWTLQTPTQAVTALLW